PSPAVSESASRCSSTGPAVRISRQRAAFPSSSSYARGCGSKASPPPRGAPPAPARLRLLPGVGPAAGAASPGAVKRGRGSGGGLPGVDRGVEGCGDAGVEDPAGDDGETDRIGRVDLEREAPGELDDACLALVLPAAEAMQDAPRRPARVEDVLRLARHAGGQ